MICLAHAEPIEANPIFSALKSREILAAGVDSHPPEFSTYEEQNDPSENI